MNHQSPTDQCSDTRNQHAYGVRRCEIILCETIKVITVVFKLQKLSITSFNFQRSSNRMTRPGLSLFLVVAGIIPSCQGYTVNPKSGIDSVVSTSDRRAFLAKTASLVTIGTLSSTTIAPVEPAQAVGPVKISLANPIYSATICPPDRPIPGEKAMKGMKGLCVTVKADLLDISPKVSLMM